MNLSEFSIDDQFYEDLDSIKSAQSGDWADLRSRINTLETKVNEIKKKYNRHTHKISDPTSTGWSNIVRSRDRF